MYVNGGQKFLDILRTEKNEKDVHDVVHIYMFFFQSDEWLQSYDLKCINMYNLDGGVYIGKLFGVFQLFESFHQYGSKSPTIAILPKKLIRLDQNGQIWLFCMIFYLFPQNEAEIDLEWSISPNSQLSHLCHQSLSFLEKSQNFRFGEGYIGKFFEFPTFQIV